MTASATGFFLQFRLDAPERLPALEGIVAALAEIKRLQLDAQPTADEEERWCEPDDPRWTRLLDDAARAHFSKAFDFTSDEGKTYLALWALSDPRVRNAHPMFTPPGPWDYESVIGSVYDAEYYLLGIHRAGQRAAILDYDPVAGPFGGTAALIQLVEAFGQTVTFDSWCTLPAAPGWDYAKAKRLVAEGHGVE